VNFYAAVAPWMPWHFSGKSRTKTRVPLRMVRLGPTVAQASGPRSVLLLLLLTIIIVVLLLLPLLTNRLVQLLLSLLIICI
jgi:hypothetical protein